MKTRFMLLLALLLGFWPTVARAQQDELRFDSDTLGLVSQFPVGIAKFNDHLRSQVRQACPAIQQALQKSKNARLFILGVADTIGLKPGYKLWGMILNNRLAEDRAFSTESEIVAQCGINSDLIYHQIVADDAARNDQTLTEGLRGAYITVRTPVLTIHHPETAVDLTPLRNDLRNDRTILANHEGRLGRLEAQMAKPVIKTPSVIPFIGIGATYHADELMPKGEVGIVIPTRIATLIPSVSYAQQFSTGDVTVADLGGAPEEIPDLAPDKVLETRDAEYSASLGICPGQQAMVCIMGGIFRQETVLTDLNDDIVEREGFFPGLSLRLPLTDYLGIKALAAYDFAHTHQWNTLVKEDNSPRFELTGEIRFPIK
jgi:hypothetical protein